VDLHLRGQGAEMTQEPPTAATKIKQTVEVRERTLFTDALIPQPNVATEMPWRHGANSMLEEAQVVQPFDVESAASRLHVVSLKRRNYSQHQIGWRDRRPMVINGQHAAE